MKKAGFPISYDRIFANCFLFFFFFHLKQDDFGYAVTKLIFLNERPVSASSAGANLVSCNASGWVRNLVSYSAAIFNPLVRKVARGL